jgi:Iodothyronine deiodinase
MSQVDSLEKMYQSYKDIAEFRIVYIKEAHAADSSWPMQVAIEKGINEHKTLEDRCATAEMLLKDKRLTIPCVIDGMDNAANEAYHAWPDRIFIVRTDGRLSVAAGQGPFGFKPGVSAANKWLAEFRESGVEPALDSKALEAATAREKKGDEEKPSGDR